MIEIDTYITILFAIVIPAIGIFITITIGNFHYCKKVDSLFILFLTHFLLTHIVIFSLIILFFRLI